mgnify:CR=1 FL=1
MANNVTLSKINSICNINDLTNEASVEAFFINPLITLLGYSNDDVVLKTSIQQFKVGKGSKSVLYKPDYIFQINGIPCMVLDAKSPSENIDDWEQQCSSYCLELNKFYDYNPVSYFILSNGIKTAVYKWDIKQPLLTLGFEDFAAENQNFKKLLSLIGKVTIKKKSTDLKTDLDNSQFTLEEIDLPGLIRKFQKLHQHIWTTEKMKPSSAFEELIKIIFVKLEKDKALHTTLGNTPAPKYKDVVFSSHWISSQTESESPINDPLFKNLVTELETQIQDGTRKRFFNKDEQIILSAETIKWIVKEIEHIDFYAMEEDVHGRMFEAFLDATVRGGELGQYFTPRDIVKLMVGLADIQVSKTHIDTVLDACCGSGGFLINAMNVMLEKANSIVGLSNIETKEITHTIKDESLFGIDAGSQPPMHRIARMNMYLHGDGGSNIFFADSLDKSLGQVGKTNIEDSKQLKELRKLILEDNKKFNVILSNPPFSMKYSRKKADQAQILSQYSVAHNIASGKLSASLLSSVMFLERYKDLVDPNGKILAIIDESVLSGQSYIDVRNYIRNNFIILGIVSLPSDAFRRASARVKTSVLILRLRKSTEIQPDIFMSRAIYVGLEEKIAKRIGIDKAHLQEEKTKEINRIVTDFSSFLNGTPGSYVVPAQQILDRLDVKYCLNDRGRKKTVWTSAGLKVVPIGKVLSKATQRKIKVDPDEVYQFLRVSYDGEISEGDRMDGNDCSYSSLYQVKEWDILLSNMGVGRGAIAIVPPYHSDKFVSSEYTILNSKTKEEAVYYCEILRTKEILGDILSSATGMNRGRIKWDSISKVEVPEYVSGDTQIAKLVKMIIDLWDAQNVFNAGLTSHITSVIKPLELNDDDARLRWLANKPPE